MTAAIEVRNLTKNYHGFSAVNDISLTVNKGEVYGLIGLNGAGKTTTFKMLLGLIKPTSGTCFIKKEQVKLRNSHLWKHVGHLVETPHCYPELTVGENLELSRKLRLIKNSHCVPAIIKKLGLTRYANTKFKNLSLGNAQRTGLAKALLHSPEILILDEPVNGLDPIGVVEIRKLLQDLALNHGVTILFSSHILSEVAKIATKIGIIDDGKLVKEIETCKLKEMLQEHLVVDTLNNELALEKLISTNYKATLSKNNKIKILNKSAINNPENIARFLVDEGVPPIMLTTAEQNLEDFFLKIISEKGGQL